MCIYVEYYVHKTLTCNCDMQVIPRHLVLVRNEKHVTASQIKSLISCIDIDILERKKHYKTFYSTYTHDSKFLSPTARLY